MLVVPLEFGVAVADGLLVCFQPDEADDVSDFKWDLVEVFLNAVEDVCEQLDN